MRKLSLRLLLSCLFLVLVWTGFAFIHNRFLNGDSEVLNPRLVPPFSIPGEVPGRQYVYFAGLGDQGTGLAGQKHVAALLNQKAQRDALHFVLLLGDNFYPNGVASTSDPQWRTKFVDMYNLPFLIVPFYAALGGHDYRLNRASFQVEYSRLNPKWVMPAAYYSFGYPIDSTSTMQFWALDTEHIIDGSKYDPEQMAWLERELQKSPATWKVVFGHHPVFSYGEHGHGKRMIKFVRPLLEKYAVDLYLSGHDHDRQMLQPIGGVHYIVSGTGGKSRDTSYGPITTFAATNLGFTWFRVSAEDFHVQFLDGDGNVEYAQTWAKGAVGKQPYDPELIMDPSPEPGKDRNRKSHD